MKRFSQMRSRTATPTLATRPVTPTHPADPARRARLGWMESLRGRGRRRGSILVLALVLVVLLAMMGAAFLQMARSDRRSTQQMDTRSQDFEDSILRYLGSILATDLEFDPTVDGGVVQYYGAETHDTPFTWSSENNFFTPNNPIQSTGGQPADRITFPVFEGALAGLTPANIGSQGGNDVGDYLQPNPLTPEVANSRVYRAAGLGPFREAFREDLDDALAFAGGFNGTTILPIPGRPTRDRGQNDDMWLASTAPVFTGQFPNGDAVVGGNAYWPHISNVTGVFLDLGPAALVESSPGAGDLVPSVYLSTADNDPESGDTWLDLNAMQAEFLNPTTNDRFADADGDGIADSRWTFAPVGGGGGLTYVMAVRIVDNSALANLNVHSQYTAAVNADTAPRWYTPTDLDLRPVFYAGTNPSPSGSPDNVGKLLADRAGARAIPNDSYDERIANWVLTAERYGNPTSVMPAVSPWTRIGSNLKRLNAAGTAGYTDAALASADDVDPNSTGVTNNPPATLGNLNEIELRWRNGLNRSSNGQSVDAPSQLENLTADPGNSTNPFWRDPAAVAAVELQYDGTNYVTYNIRQFFEDEPRKRFSIITGSGDFNRLNLNVASEDEIDKFLSDLDNEGSPLNGNAFNFDLIDDANLNNWGGFARAASVFVKDWRDTDTVGDPITDVVPRLTKGGIYYGMEYLPFISEVYLKAEYEVSSIVPGLMADNVTPSDNVNWDATGDYWVIIELVNPWDRPIPIADIDLVLRDTGSGNENKLGDLRAQILAALPAGRDFLLPNEMLTLHVGNVAAGGDFDELTLPANTAAPRVDLEAGGNVVDWGFNASSRWTTSDLALSLRVPTSGGDIEYQDVPVPYIPNSVSEDYAVPAPHMVGDSAVARVGVIGTAAGLAMLAVHPDDLTLQGNFANEFTGRDDVPPTNETGPSLQVVMEDEGTLNAPTTEHFGDYDKNANSADPTPGYTGASLDTRVQNIMNVGGTAGPGNVTYNDTTFGTAEPFIIGNAGQFYRATDFFRIVFLGPREDSGNVQSVAEVWRERNAMASTPTTTFDLTDFMIDTLPDTTSGPDWISAAPVDSDPVKEKTTFSAFLLSKLSTFAPNSDGLDNDGDGRIDDTDERLVPGRINVNTVPINPSNSGNDDDMLERLLPAFGATVKDELAELIRLARTDPNHPDFTPGSFSTSYRTLRFDGPGIANLAELFESNTWIDLTASLAGGAITGDFNEYESDLKPSTDGIAFGADGYNGDAEEKLAGLGALNQVLDVRSDVFTAYVLVRGYLSNDFSANPPEEYRITAVFDRSVVHATRPLPRLVSVAVFRQQ